ncbi:valine--tRNA ligase [Elstera cyanobacteriorum]|uniref:Valine--tRNA ligase n=1 Tax=Elstera cyanobacteriorum TaxID=2022747 RepID=A0A255XNR7_9PROT|nr:valine--tRNA ligase [Elstera cyanobacteriorum]OYQ18628.1 valine--tRNA ligase [Elstera cyanobacteriorum]GFZ78969.1 valine--tRNA ligase [Elstera cyanobacteriorum]
MLEKTYTPADLESRFYPMWEQSGGFAATGNGNQTPYTIMMPPPNVTGSLHMGHALTFTLQDILIRYHRARGFDALWQPGTDHAGIATQMVVERKLEAEGKRRVEMGRDAFIAKVWDWKEESGGTIVHQLRRLGASADWARERFTMDEGMSAAVRKVFVDLYRDGLIYRDKRLVNWDPKLHTAISDLEVEPKEVKGNLWHLQYPIEGTDQFITVATTRPETMFGDTGVAVHPEDERYKDFIGKYVVLPLVGRRIPIVADEYSDPEKGTGAVKLTPAHDFNDFEVGRRHALALINIFDRDARLNDNAPEAYRGMDRFEARKKLVQEFEELGVLVKVEPHTHMVPHGDRSGVVIEPWLTDQWYCDAVTLAKPALEAVETGRTKFVPEQWTNTYYQWMRNIQPWCISRQLWWGHQIPAWYGPDGKIFVAETEAEAQAEADAHYGTATALTRDTDVLDTWFSSALFPFSTLGWPEKTADLARYYPGDVLVTGFDIIFFWVARMMMMGMHFMGDVPFRTVYIHALVRDEKGQKMSKSKGNVIDPLDLIDKYGCDALRFTLAAMAAPGRDVKMSTQRVEGYRNFATKLWNATRFAEMNGCARVADFDPAAAKGTVNRWIIGELAGLRAKLDEAIAAYRFNDAANLLYSTAWGSFCDWYVEFTKPILTGEDAALIAETKATTAWALEQIARLLHPFMPFLTEALWEHLSGGSGEKLLVARWPDLPQSLIDPAAAAEMTWVIGLISQIRGLRAEMNVPPGTELAALFTDLSGETARWAETHKPVIQRLARVAGLGNGTATATSVQVVEGQATLALDLAGAIDPAAERARLTKEKGKAEQEAGKIEKKLGNADFIAKADPAVIEENRERLADAQALIARLDTALARLAAL